MLSIDQPPFVFLNILVGFLKRTWANSWPCTGYQSSEVFFSIQTYFLSQNLQEWLLPLQGYFCIKTRCIQQYCDNNDDCPDESQCIDEICLKLTTCSDDSDCQFDNGGFLICDISESEEFGICRPEDEPPPGCIDLSECPPVSNLIFSNYLTNYFPLSPFPFPPFPFLPFPCLLLPCPCLPWPLSFSLRLFKDVSDLEMCIDYFAVVVKIWIFVFLSKQLSYQNVNFEVLWEVARVFQQNICHLRGMGRKIIIFTTFSYLQNNPYTFLNRNA